jgi:hypothetical protein
VTRWSTSNSASRQYWVMICSMEPVPHPEPESIDEQLGSPALTFESGWLVGVIVGLMTILIVGRHLRRRRRRATRDPIDES